MILIVDTSGSMAIYEYALGPIVWIIDSGLRMVGGRMATGLFGNAAELRNRAEDASRCAWYPGSAPGRHSIRRRRDRDVRRPARDREPQRPRLCYIPLSDGGWYEHPGRRREGRLARRLGGIRSASRCCYEPLSVQAARISVISDPADALTVVADDSVHALRTPMRTIRARVRRAGVKKPARQTTQGASRLTRRATTPQPKETSDGKEQEHDPAPRAQSHGQRAGKKAPGKTSPTSPATARTTAAKSGRGAGGSKRPRRGASCGQDPRVDRLFDVTVAPDKPICEDVAHVTSRQITLAENHAGTSAPRASTASPAC